MDHRPVLAAGLCAAALLASPTFSGATPITTPPVIPTDIDTTVDGDAQMAVDIYAWNTFLGLMAPSPDATGRKPTPRIWQTWKEQYEVYPPAGVKPSAWGAPQSVPASCAGTEGGYLIRDEKVDDVLDATLQAVKADGTLPGTLKDQQGRLVRYEIRMNRTVFDYIVGNQLYDGNVQGKATEIRYPVGSMIIKAAWKELSPGEHTDRYLTRNSCICQDVVDGQPRECHTAQTGLVGFHVMHKTDSAPQWLWSTFEHVANVVPSHGMPAIFNNPHCSGPYCADNSQTPDNAASTGGIPNQVTQVLATPAELAGLNTDVQDYLPKLGPDYTVLANYQLMSAQWPTSNTDLKQPPTVFTVAPTFSANTTMETFAQSSSSCMGCHVMSRGLNPTQFVSGDYTFTLNNANPTPAGATCNSYDYANSMFCSDDLILYNPVATHPANIQRGYELISRTYERLPDHVGNKLHCSSCHLHTGGDPNAAWWVGMSAAYADQPGGLAGRINGCFERSMNGSDLCDPDFNCDSNRDMQDIIAYMDWLTAEYEKQHGCVIGGASPACQDVPRHYPAMNLTGLTGDISDGHAIYQQKCAFCHNDEGQGRYESNTYFRPALWGPNSFAATAGMAQTKHSAPFLRWNMPYTSGGLLTDQEAMDLACFIDAKPRPQMDQVDPTQKPPCQP